MDLDAVRTFAAVADAGQFSEAADGLSVSQLATLVGEQTHLAYPPGWDLRRIPVRDPVPVYPHSLLWLGDNPHPALTALREHLAATAPPDRRDAGTWAPAWAAPAAPAAPVAPAVTARR